MFIVIFGASRCTLKSVVSGMRNWLWCSSLNFCAVENLAALVVWWWEKLQDQMLSGKMIHGMHWGIEHRHLFISSQKREADYIPKVHSLSWQFNTPGSYFHRNNHDLLAVFCLTKGFNWTYLETKLPFVRSFLRRNVFCYVARRKGRFNEQRRNISWRKRCCGRWGSNSSANKFCAKSKAL